MNRVSGVAKVSEATVEELQRRLDKADAWLTHLGPMGTRLAPPQGAGGVRRWGTMTTGHGA